jgi:hypothetical protein
MRSLSVVVAGDVPVEGADWTWLGCDWRSAMRLMMRFLLRGVRGDMFQATPEQ